MCFATNLHAWAVCVGAHAAAPTTGQEVSGALLANTTLINLRNVTLASSGKIPSVSKRGGWVISAITYTAPQVQQ